MAGESLEINLQDGLENQRRAAFAEAAAIMFPGSVDAGNNAVEQFGTLEVTAER